MKGHYTADGKPRCAAEKPAAELLATVFDNWRRDVRCCRSAFTQFRPAVVARLDEASPEWRLFARMLSDRVIRPRDNTSARLDKLHRLFLAGLSPVDELDEGEAEPELTAAE